MIFTNTLYNTLCFISTMVIIILKPDNIKLTFDQFGRLPVLFAMVNDLATDTDATLTVIVPDNMSASDILEYSSYEDADEYALSGIPARAEVARRTLDWCGIDMGTLRTPKELREEIKLAKLEVVKVAHLDCIEFENSDCSHFVACDFDFSTMHESWKDWNIKTMDDVIELWKLGPLGKEVPFQKRYTLLCGLFETDLVNIASSKAKGITVGKRVHIGGMGPGCEDDFYPLTVIRDAHGCKRIPHNFNEISL